MKASPPRPPAKNKTGERVSVHGAEEDHVSLDHASGDSQTSKEVI